MKLWLDDIRLPPGDDWVWAKTVQDAMQELDLADAIGVPIHISFDHDLGDDDKIGTGYTLASMIESMAYQGKVFNIESWTVHSANPIGAARIKVAMESFDRIRLQAAE